MMWLKPYALLAVMSLVIASVQAQKPTPKAPGSTAATTTTSTTAASSMNHDHVGTVFKLPTNIDEDELLHEMGLYMTSIMNTNIDPCEDFYEFACGNWRNSTRIPPGGHTQSQLAAMQKEINDLIVGFLKNSSSAAESTTAEGKAKTFYSSCIMNGKDTAVGIKTLLDNEKAVYEKQKLTGTDDWILINFMSPYNVYPLLPLSVNYSTQTRQFEVSISEPIHVLEHFPNASKPEELTQIFGVIASEYKLMLEFERNLTSKVEASNSTERLNLADFLKAHQKDAIDWQKIFSQAFGEHISPAWYINNRIGNFTELERFLRKSNTENLRNYVKWRTILKFYEIWTSELADDEKREQICRQHTETYFSFALLPWFIDNLYNAEQREDTLMMANSILESFLNMTAEYPWLDEDTRSHITSKLQAMDIYVGYKDELHHRELINEIYNDVEVTTDWFTNLQTLEANRAQMRLKSVHKTVLPPMSSPFSVYAYYADYINTAFITMGISQMPLYHKRFPDSLKFGSLGMLIGHEMAHSVDNNGYHKNYDGKHYAWPPTTLRHFQERLRCLQNQYNKFIFRGIQTNGTSTLANNIADNAGARLAHNSYMQRLGLSEGQEKPIPGMNYNNDELFFIKLAQTWCNGYADESKINHIRTDTHAFGEFRVLGLLRNMREFSNTFHCKLGSQLNPLKKCLVW